MKRACSNFRVVFSVVLAVLAASSTAHAVDIDEEIWGYDGRILPSEFNLLSVRISNPTDTPFDGVIRLSRRDRAAQTVGALMVERVYVSPFSTRWVQFYPYVNDAMETFSLSVSGQPSVTVQAPRKGKRMPVLLVPADAVASRGGDIRRFNEENFPPTVTATKSLHSLFIDRMPRWEAPRREAFYDWLHLGGIVHVLQDESGEWPKFTDELAVLNEPLETSQVGRGYVFRHEFSVAEVNKKKLSEVERKVKVLLEPEKDEAEVAVAQANQANVQNWNNNYGIYNTLPEQFRKLRELTRPSHNWLLIYCLAFAYIACVFPGCFILGKKRMHYFVTYGAILGVAALFSLIFLSVGKRGYGEETSVNSFSVATPIGNGDWDVLQWANVFVTDGDDYTISHKGKGRLYSTCESYERVNGVIDNGVDGSFQVDIPPFSNRTYAMRTKLKLKDINVTCEEFAASTKLNVFKFRTDGTWPRDVVTCIAQYRDKFYNVAAAGKALQQIRGSAKQISRMLEFRDFNSFYSNGMYALPDEDTDTEKQFQEIWQPMLAWHLGVIEGRTEHDISVPSGIVRLYVVAKAPDTLHVVGDRFPQQNGYVIYVLDVPGKNQ